MKKLLITLSVLIGIEIVILSVLDQPTVQPQDPYSDVLKFVDTLHD